MPDAVQFGVIRTIALGTAVFCRNILTVAAVTLPVLVIWIFVFAFRLATAASGLVEGLLYLACFSAGVVMISIIMARAVNDLDGERSTLLALFRVGARSLLRILFLVILVILIVVLVAAGLLPFGLDADKDDTIFDWILVGFWMLVMPFFLPAIPAIVVEELGPIAGLKRSFALTKGHRWKMFAIIALGCLAYAEVAGFISFMFRDAVIDVAMDVLFFALGASIAGAAYHQLRGTLGPVDRAAFD